MNASQIGVEISRAAFVEFLNSVQPGQFFHVRGYVNAEGEKSDYFLRFGCKYPNLKARDIKFLRNVLAGAKAPALTIRQGVYIPPSKAMLTGIFPATPSEHDVWATIEYTVDRDGTALQVTQSGHINLLDTDTFTNRKGNKKDGYNVPATVSYTLPSNHPLVTAAIGEADLQGTVLQGLVRPAEATSEYEEEAQSAYSLEKDGKTRWYIRGVLIVRKIVRVQGDYGFSASLPINAVKKAIQSQWLLTGKYRQFILGEGQFEAMTIEGQAILVDGADDAFYFALPESVAEAVTAEVAG